MKGIYLTIFGICMLIYGLCDFELGVSVLMPFIVTTIISILCIIVGLIFRKSRIEICDILKEIY